MFPPLTGGRVRNEGASAGEGTRPHSPGTRPVLYGKVASRPVLPKLITPKPDS
jgi:hypothetical protein